MTDILLAVWNGVLLGLILLATAVCVIAPLLLEQARQIRKPPAQDPTGIGQHLDVKG